MNYKINYDELAQNYSIYRNACPRIITHILNELNKINISNMLEIGCGTADHLYCLKEILKNEAYGFDNSINMIKKGKQKNPGLNLSLSDVEEKFPYENNYLNFAFSINVIHYIKDLNHYFKETYRVLKNGGIILTVTDSEEDICNRTMSKYFGESIDIELRRYPAISNIIKEMEKVGFKEIKTTHTNHKYKIDKTELEKFKKKAFSSIRLISSECFEEGIKRMEKEVKKGICKGNENYTYVWSIK